jgi:3D (Asp-Asp-Asp) domain-containing protein
MFLMVYLTVKPVTQSHTLRQKQAPQSLPEIGLFTLIATQSSSEPELTEATLSYVGEFKITVYTPYCDGGNWGYLTATGVTSEHLATCAVDPKTIKLGSTIHVGDLTLIAVDTGSAVKGNIIDVFYDGTQAEARKWIAEFGTVADVWLD